MTIRNYKWVERITVEWGMSEDYNMHRQGVSKN